MNDYQKFKKLLEYFVAHLEYCANRDPSGRGYKEYIEPIEPWIKDGPFNHTGLGYKGHDIQKQIEKWADYNEGTICIAVRAASNYQSRGSFLHWDDPDTWFNIRARWNENGSIASLCLTSKKDDSDETSNMERSLDDLGLFNGNYEAFSDDFKEFFGKFMSYKNLQGASSMT